jgi:hypothetical protein
MMLAGSGELGRDFEVSRLLVPFFFGLAVLMRSVMKASASVSDNGIHSCYGISYCGSKDVRVGFTEHFGEFLTVANG